MRLEDIVEKNIKLNNQEIFILEKSELRNIHDIKEIEEFEDMSKSIAHAFEFIIKYSLERDDFLVAVYKFPSTKQKYVWLSYLLYEYFGQLYRIDLQNYQCNCCKNTYKVGNVGSPSLFIDGVSKEYLNMMDKVEKYPKAKCPYCGEVISRFWVIWANDKKQNE